MSYVVVFEGMDYSGKSTQINKFIENLKTHNLTHIVLKEPDSVLPSLKQLLNDENITPKTELFLFLASRVEVSNLVRKYKEMNVDVIILDRFTYSTYAYQSSFSRPDGVCEDMILLLNNFATDNLVSDVVFYIDILVDEMYKRREMERSYRDSQQLVDKFEKFDKQFYEKVRQMYLRISEFPEKYGVKEFVVCDGLLPSDELSNTIFRQFQNIINDI